jgi:hypothetical protein
MFPKSILFILVFPLLLFIVFKLISGYNLNEVKPTPKEVSSIVENFGDITINSESDIIKIQNKSFDLIEFNGDGLDHHQKIVIDSLFKWKRALCFHRSLLLQKIFLYNKINVIPVFLYFNKEDPSSTSIFDILDKDLQSHNVFIAEFKGKSYLIQTNHRMQKLLTLDEYMNSTIMPKGTKYLKHLNNRNGIYLSPSWLPDIY